MKMRFCPDCVQLIHFESDAPIQRCWNCGALTDFSLLRTRPQKLALWLGWSLDRALPSCSRLEDVGRVALIAAVPSAVIMLLLCNSLHITIVHESAAPFFGP